MELQVVKYKAVNTDGFSSRLRGEVRVLNHRINCTSTNITSVLFGADLRQRTLYPSFQLWRFNATSNLSVVVDERVIYFSTANVSTNGVFEYPFDPPIPAVNGDLVAISQPSSSNSILLVLLLTV
jgi:ephrin-B